MDRGARQTTVHRVTELGTTEATWHRLRVKGLAFGRLSHLLFLAAVGQALLSVALGRKLSSERFRDFSQSHIWSLKSELAQPSLGLFR